MASKPDNVKRLVLMCKNHEACRFSWSLEANMAIGKIQVVDERFVPLGCRDRSGKATRTSLTSYMLNRAIPSLRPGAVEKLRKAGVQQPAELLVLGYGLGLSDRIGSRTRTTMRRGKM